MKTILELSPKGNVLYSMPDDTYEILIRLLRSPSLRPVSPYGRSRALSVREALPMLPDAWRATVKQEARQEYPEPRPLPVVYYSEVSDFSSEDYANLQKHLASLIRNT